MPQSRKNKERKQKQQNYKNKQKMMNDKQREQMAQTLPPVRQIPVWSSDADIAMKGFEFEALQNSIVQLQVAQQSIQSIMSRNLVEGNIKMDFEKLNPQTLEYEPMTDEEKKPHQDDFAKAVENVKQAAEKMKQEAGDVQPTPSVDDVPQTPNPPQTQNVEDITAEELTEQLPVEETGAKIITLPGTELPDAPPENVG